MSPGKPADFRPAVIGSGGRAGYGALPRVSGAEIGCSVEDVQALLLGGHGDDMVPLARYTFAGGIPITQLVKKERLEEIIKRTRNGGAEIVSCSKGKRLLRPGGGHVQMAESIIRDKKRILPCAAYCDKEYGIGGYFVGVPCVLGIARRRTRSSRSNWTRPSGRCSRPPSSTCAIWCRRSKCSLSEVATAGRFGYIPRPHSSRRQGRRSRRRQGRRAGGEKEIVISYWLLVAG
jgi:hypothetical protein